MCLIYFSISYIDEFGNRGSTPNYFVYFDKTNPMVEPDYVLEEIGRRSFENKNPGCKVLSIRVASKHNNVWL